MDISLDFFGKRGGADDAGYQFQAMQTVLLEHMGRKTQIEQPRIRTIGRVRVTPFQIGGGKHALGQLVRVKTLPFDAACQIPDTAKESLPLPGQTYRRPVGVISVLPTENVILVTYREGAPGRFSLLLCRNRRSY